MYKQLNFRRFKLNNSYDFKSTPEQRQTIQKERCIHGPVCRLLQKQYEQGTQAPPNHKLEQQPKHYLSICTANTGCSSAHDQIHQVKVPSS